MNDLFEKFLGTPVLLYYEAGQKIMRYLGTITQVTENHILLQEKKIGEIVLLKAKITQLSRQEE